MLELGLRARLRGRRRADGGRSRAFAIAEPPEPLPGAPLVAIAMATFEPPLDLFRAPGGVDPRADADRLDLRRERRLLRSRTVRRAASGCSTATRGSCSHAPTGGAASTTTSSARWSWRSGRRAVTSPSPIRTTSGTPTSSRRSYARSATPSSCTATSGSSRPAASGSRRRTGRSARQQPLGHAVAAGGELRHRRSVAVPARAARRRPAAPAGPVHRTSTTTGSRSPLSRSATSASSTAAALRLRAARQHATLGHADGDTDRRACATGCPRFGAARASGCGCGACTTSSTPAGCSSSPPSSSMRCGDGMSRRKRRRARPLHARRPLRAPDPTLFARGARELVRRRPETLGAEWMLGYAFAWRRLLGASRRATARSGRLRLDALPPLVLHPSPARTSPGRPDLRDLAQHLAARCGSPWPTDAPERINLLIPDVRPAPLLRRVHREAPPGHGASRSGASGSGS